MYQKQLGEKSLWAAYIELMPEVKFFCKQDAEEMIAT
jgi:hypothetical protein